MSVNRKRMTVKKEMEWIDIDGLTLSKVVDKFEALIKKYGKDAIIEKVWDNSLQGELYKVFKRIPETDEQMRTRIAQQERYEKQEFEQYQRLKKKFDSKSKRSV